MKALSVKSRMLLASLFVVLSLAATWAVDSHFYRTVNANHDVRHLLDELHSRMLALRQAEKDFLASRDLAHVTRFGEIFAAWQSDYTRLRDSMTEAGIAGERMAAVQERFVAYRDSFMEVVEKQQSIGLTWDEGHYGALRESAEQVEAIISEDDGLMRSLLTLRRHEKDFMLNRDVVHASAFISALAPFRNRFFMSEIDNAIKAKAQKALREYTDRFEQLVALEKEIGLDMSGGILGRMSESVDTMEAAFRTSRQQMDRLISEQVRDSRRYSMILVGSVMAGAVLLLMLINRSISRNLAHARDVARSLARGEWQRRIDIGGSREIAELLNDLSLMRDDLVTKSAEIRKDSELKGRHSELAGLLRGLRGEDELCQDVVRYLAPALGCQVGVVYLMDEDRLRYAAGYGMSRDANETVEVGEGLVGQVAKIRKSRLVRDLPPGYCEISSATGSAPPRELLLVPLIWNDQVFGVLELGSFSAIGESAREFMHQAGEAIAIALNAARTRTRMEAVLAQTQRQADELASQQREKEAAYARLAEQTEKLQASEEELRVQEEELRVINEELESQTRLLHDKNREVEARNRELERLLEEKRLAG